MNTKVAHAFSWALALCVFTSLPACDPAPEEGESGESSSKEKDGEDKPSKDGSTSEGEEDEDNETTGSKDESDSAGEGEETGSEDDTGSGSEEEPDGSGDEGPVIPKDYKGKKNPKSVDDEKVVEAGKKIFEVDCEGCHAASGKGEFPGTPDMTSDAFAKLGDDYLLWKTSEGAGDIMSGFKDKLSLDQIWEVITYMRTLSK